MKIYVSVDIEGVSGVVHGDMMMPSAREYDRGRRLMTRDANAAIQGLVDGGADYILASDGHGPMRNLLVEELHDRAHLMTGTGDARDHCQLEGADAMDFDAAVFVGYHAMARTQFAIHPHTIAGAVVSELRLNGIPHGETGLNAAVLATLGIPTIMVTGDETTMTEARRFLGESIQTVAVKQARGHNAAICRPLADCHAEIAEAATKALASIGDVPLYRPDTPWTLEVDFNTMAQCNRASRTAGVERRSSLGVTIYGDTPWDQYQNLWAALRSALYEPASWLA
ncbi:MAG TPA: M55 family metallopeptidase [Thermomicrobiales bacterium]|nr:M55 family metallopeptidase [Thermomicrobiales bacterium]